MPWAYPPLSASRAFRARNRPRQVGLWRIVRRRWSPLACSEPRDDLSLAHERRGTRPRLGAPLHSCDARLVRWIKPPPNDEAPTIDPERAKEDRGGWRRLRPPSTVTWGSSAACAARNVVPLRQVVHEGRRLGHCDCRLTRHRSPLCLSRDHGSGGSSRNLPGPASPSYPTSAPPLSGLSDRSPGRVTRRPTDISLRGSPSFSGIPRVRPSPSRSPGRWSDRLA